MPSTPRKEAAGSIFPVFLLASLLAACGGGGGSSTTTTNPDAVPPLQQPQYNGEHGQGNPDLATADLFAQDVFAAADIVDLNGLELFNGIQAHVQDASAAAFTNGTVKVDEHLSTPQSGWIREVFTVFRPNNSPTEAETGTIVYYQDEPQVGVNTCGAVSFDNLAVTSNRVTYTYNGTLACTRSSSGMSLAGNLSISGNGYQQLISNLVLSGDVGTGAVMLTGRVYDGSAGYVTVSTPTATMLGQGSATAGQFPDIFPEGSTGDVAIVGAGGAVIHVEPLNQYFAWLGLDINHDGQADYGARIDRGTGEIDATQPTGTSVQALTELPTPATHIGAVTVDGRYSYTPGGWVTYSWQLLSAPLGSAVKVSGTGPTVQFTPDLVGDYLLQLTATDGNKSAVEAVHVNHQDGSASATNTAPTTQYKVASYIHAHVGQSVALDGRASQQFRSDGSNVWVLHVPAGSHASLTSNSDYLTSFTPDQPGIYYAILGYTQNTFMGFGVPPSAVSIISVDEPFRFAPPVVAIPFAPDAISRAKFGGNGDGLALMVPPAVAGTTDSGIEAWQPMVDGLFKYQGVTDVGSGLFEGLAAIDLNGDGVTDYSMASSFGTSCTMAFLESGIGGYTSSSLTYDSKCINASFTSAPLIHSSIIGGHPAVVIVDPSYALQGPVFAATLADSSGAMQAPIYTGVSGGAPGADSGIVNDFELQDVTGDGEPDLIASINIGTITFPHEVVQVFKGNGDGSFTYLASYSPAGSGVPLIAAGDFNGDGHVDIAVANTDTLSLFYGDGTGAFSATPETRSLECLTGSIDAQDLNGDGKADLIIGVDGGCSSVAFEGYGILELFLSESSTASGGTTSLGQEQDYPMLNESFGSGWATNQAIPGDYNGDGLQDLLFNNTLLLQLPAITSATITSTSLPLQQTARVAAPRTPSSRAWVKSMARVKIAPPL